MGKNLDKFLLLMWKNWKLQYRRPLQTAVEILAPVVFSALLVILRSLVNPEENSQITYTPFHPIPMNLFTVYLINNGTNYNTSKYLKTFSLAYSPSTNKILDRSMKILKFFFNEVKGYEDSEQLEAHFLSNKAKRTLAGVEFDNNLYGLNNLPLDLKVSLRFPGELRSTTGRLLRYNYIQTPELKKQDEETVTDKLHRLFNIVDWKTNLLYPIFQSPGPRDAEINNGAFPNYYAEGFLALQILVTSALILGQKNVTSVSELHKIFKKTTIPAIFMKRFPHASWKHDPLLPALIGFIGILIMLSFVYTCINTVKMITTEKEKQLKEAMKIMGLPNWLHWTAWFIKCLTFLLISIILIVIMLKVPWYPRTNLTVFTFSDPSVLFLFLLLYMCSTITFCFAISVCFSKANTAATVAGLLWFISYAPYLFLQQQYEGLSLSTKLFASLGSNTAMAYGFQLMLMYESTNEGIQWNNVWQTNTIDDNLTLGLIMTILIVDALIYLMIALYVEKVFPGEYGTPLKWYFLFTPSFWCKDSKHTIPEDPDYFTQKNDCFEEHPSGLHIGIQIVNLCKTFGKKIAVKNLSLNIYDNQITVLLGHNGAGKTTTMSILTGIIPPTSGTAIVAGYDIRKNMKDARANLGLCPQHNILFDDLTVKEHLYFFTKLKGIEKDKIKVEINNYTKLLQIESIINKKAFTLSGGMKRKLCVGIALCGNSKVVLLDEPSAGMDPSARRALWDLLQEQKHGRSILLTTHFMDEADLLGDRIAIMADGELECCGSSFFLKKKYGTGYYLIFDKSLKCEPEKVTELLQNYIPDIKIHENVGSELSYILPENKVAVFETMLKDLERNTQKLGIFSYGISLTTLEEVFMKIGTNPVKSNEITKNELLQNNKKTESHQSKLFSKKMELSTGCELIYNQFIAMLMKKFLSIIRTWTLLFIQILIPVSFLIIAIIASRRLNKNYSGDLPKLVLSLDSYEDPITLVEINGTNVFHTIYYDVLKRHKIKNVSSISKTMLELTKEVPPTVRKKYIVGASFNKIEDKNWNYIIAWFNNDPYHSPPLALGLVLNAVYKYFVGKNSALIFVNHPLPFTANTKVQKLLRGNSMGFQLAFNIGFSMAFVSSFYILFYVKERVCKSKHLQFVSGLKVYIFWITSLFCDLMTFIITILALIITLICFQEPGFRSLNELGRIFLLLFYFGFAILPVIYFASYLFDVPSTGYTRMTLFSVFTGVAAFLIVQILSTPGLLLQNIANGLHWGFLLFPHYSLATGIRDTYITYATSKMCNIFVSDCTNKLQNFTADECWDIACYNNLSSLSSYCCVREQNYFKWESPGIGRNLTYSFLVGLTLFLLLNIQEYHIFSKIAHKYFKKYRRKLPRRIPDEDSDVLAENEKIRNIPETQLHKEYTVVLKDFTKYYGNLLAINGICLGITEFECFGLLGVNGAGKTTTFKMLTGDIGITYGEGWIGGFSIKTKLKKVQKLIGYCPQFDALLSDLNAKEILTIHALIRGIRLKECPYIVEKLAIDFDFYKHLNKRVKQLSGGNKRKLSTAISLIGDPPVICLDEPTAGMDPITKRHLWNAICRVRDSGKCVILTSHSMEECEALCTRLAIMVNGSFKCLGSTQHLKSKFAEGYVLTIKMKKTGTNEDFPSNVESIDRFIKQYFPTAFQREKHQELLTYYITDKSISWSEMFGILEKNKTDFNIEDYSLGQSTLEQVFLSFTGLQN